MCDRLFITRTCPKCSTIWVKIDQKKILDDEFTGHFNRPMDLITIDSPQALDRLAKDFNIPISGCHTLLMEDGRVIGDVALVIEELKNLGFYKNR